MASVLFVQNNFFHCLGVMWISSVLKQHGHRTKLVIAFTPKQVGEAVRRLQPDLVGFHTMTGAHRFVLGSAAAAKQARPETRVILGGPHATFFPEIVNEPQVDFVCIGEGEYATLDLCNRLDAGGSLHDIANLWSR